MDLSFIVLIPVVYAIVETMEKIGVKRKYAHLTAVPLGIFFSFIGLNNQSIKGYIIDGILIGISSVGICDTLCNIFDIIKNKRVK